MRQRPADTKLYEGRDETIDSLKYYVEKGRNMKFALLGVLFLGLAILCYDKHCDRLKVICYYIAIVFLVLGAINVMVGDFRLIFGH